MAKKTAAKKKSSKKAAPPRAAKKAAPPKAAKKAAAPKAAKKAAAPKAAKKKAAPVETEITEDHWAKVYAKAWLDEGFRTLLETDPTAALEQYANENGIKWSKRLVVPPVPTKSPADQDENCIHLVSCC
ncbi:hypothetical protein [Paraliomyxa miuraensis]|uniref:hypothetical protein n=1 Tax=Paraliomyxa miuraensis TaxID=376150 RepID=UPI00225071D6|nr:hypothetical protein [Paraliomyxa miuraensis]MCX4247018.1 nitrile hydratase subunit alpha [Paraliomyxa miuraensis]